MTDGGSVRRVGLLVLGVNIALAFAKALVWWATGSLAVGSEAVNSGADAIYSLVVVGGLYLTTRPPDFEHPHGHERIEPFVSLFVAVGMFVAGGAVLLQAVQSILAGEPGIVAGAPAVIVLVVAAVTKWWLYRYCLVVGDEQHSPAITATAIDNRNDVLTASAALAGVIGAELGAPVLDPLAAGVVAIGIIYSGVGVVRDNVDYLVGRAPPEDLRSKIVKRAIAHPEVKGAHDVVAHYVGPEVDVSLHVEVEGDRTLREAHEIETAVMEAVAEVSAVDDVFVHVDPREAGEWKADADVDRLTNSDQASDRSDLQSDNR